MSALLSARQLYHRAEESSMLASVLACEAEGSLSHRQACDLGNAIAEAIEGVDAVEPTVAAIVERRRTRDVFRWGMVTPKMGRALACRLAATVAGWRAL